MKGMMHMKKILAAVTAAAVLSGVGALPAAAEEKSDDIVILYTNDVHGGIDDFIGYDGLALYKREMEATHKHVLLADAGDAIQGAAVTTMSKGAYVTELMNFVGFDAATIGNHEFDYGLNVLTERGAELECGYTCCNFVHTDSGEAVFEPYKMIELGDTKIAFVGAVTPETFAGSAPACFQDEAGNFIYSFSDKEGMLYDVIQKNVDKVRAEGADYVILLAHLGETSVTEEWSAQQVAANTVGIDAVIDGYSHDVTPEFVVDNKNGEKVTITQTGTKLCNIGKMTISADGIKTEIVTEVPAPDESMGLAADSWTVAEDRGVYVDVETAQKINEIKTEIDAIKSRKLAHSAFELYSTDPETGKRLVRNSETNLGDLCADAYRALYGSDVGIANGGGIRKSLKAGDITYGNILELYPYENRVCEAKVTGQQILDMLEMGASAYPDESGAFYSVSGMEYTIDESVASSVVLDENGAFQGVNGEYRVKNVKIGGEPLVPDKIYTVTSINFLLQNGGDGYIVSGKCEVTREHASTDAEIMADYLENTLGGVIPEEYRERGGQGRIKIVDGTSRESSQDESVGSAAESSSKQEDASSSKTTSSSTSSKSSAVNSQNPNTGSQYAVGLLMIAMAGACFAIRRKNDK